MKYFMQLLKPPKDFIGEMVVLVYHDMEILVERKSGKKTLPGYNSISAHYDLSESPVPLGIMDGVFYSAIYVDDKTDIPDDTEFINVRFLYRTTDEDLFSLAGLGRQLADWDRTFRFCGRCGTRTENLPDERAKLCPSCSHISYPRISPAVICSVKKGNEILLARGVKFTHNVYSVLAGFVEPGETLEETVGREIMEETGISVKNIKYFGNQPWPFSSSMMIAFTAEYKSGEIRIDEKEILDAAWYSPDNLPMLPSSYSIARSLIMDFVEKTKDSSH
jgi:NAD+ diphosphatase